MTSRTFAGLAALTTLVLASGCARDLTDLELADFPSQGEIFTDGFGDGVDFQAFAGSKFSAVSLDPSVAYEGNASLRVDVPEPTDPAGSYAGGAFTARTPRDLSGYDALTFWARASMTATLDVAGLGNDNTGTSLYTAEVLGLPMTTSWRRYAIPIPDPDRLDQEGGLFFFAEGAENGTGYSFWIDELQYAALSTVTNPRPVIPETTVSLAVGESFDVTGTSVTYSVDGEDVTVGAFAAYFDWVSSDESVATVDPSGRITRVADGTATITAILDGVPTQGAVLVSSANIPSVAAPTPTVDPANVISLFSDAYTDVTVDTWRTEWSSAVLEEVQVAGNPTKKYTDLVFVGIETVANQLDITSMTHLHLDIWTPDPTAPPAVFRVKLVDFGADGAFDGGDDVEHEVTLTANTTPALATGSWVSLEIPLSDFTGLTTRENVAQLILSGDPDTVFVDNVYFHN